jgi:hypothetical protein
VPNLATSRKLCSLMAGELRVREGRQLVIGVGDVGQDLFGNLIDALLGVPACILGAPTPVRWFILVGLRCKAHGGQTSDTDTKFRSVNAVFSGPPQLFWANVAQLCALGKKLVARGNEKHDPLAFWIGHRQGDKAGFCFQPSPMLGIALLVRRFWRH